MKTICIFLSFFLISACTNTDDINTEIPECIQIIIDDNLSYVPLKTIRVQKKDGELHYWLNTDARHWDGGEAIVTATCDTICGFCGECIEAECAGEYEEDEWVIIWDN